MRGAPDPICPDCAKGPNWILHRLIKRGPYVSATCRHCGYIRVEPSEMTLAALRLSKPKKLSLAARVLSSIGGCIALMWCLHDQIGQAILLGLAILGALCFIGMFVGFIWTGVRDR